MKNNYLKRALLSCLVLLNFIMVNAASVTGHTSGNWWQAAGYAGLGNQNELLAFGEYTPASTEVTVKFKLQGEYAKFVNRVCLYARKYDESTTSNSSQIAKTFEQLWDYRDPIGNTGAVLLSQTTTITGDEITLTGSGLTANSKYVFYVAADIANKVSELPAIKGSSNNFTRIGAQITEMSSGSGKATLTQKYCAENGKANDNGLRVLVPQLKTMYAPSDYYSKYYRIPAIVTASDGSLVAVSDARKQHIHDITNDIDMLSRRSNDNGQTWSSPMTIAKGTTGTNSSTGAFNCQSSIGYGDASFAALPNGDLLCAFIHGYGLSSTDGLSDNSYVISRDNGQTWGESKYMCDKDSNKLILLTNYRGNIAPGNMCVVKSGLLAGKVIACFRITNKTTKNRRGTYTNSGQNGNYFVTYDPSGDYWNILSKKDKQYSYLNYNDDDFFYQNSATSGDGTDDEAQLIEIGENTFLMSIRSDGWYKREFAIITLTQGNNGVYYTAEALDNCGMSSTGTQANGAICKYTAMLDNAETEYLIHTLPTTNASADQGPDNSARSSLCVYTVKTADVKKSGFKWNKSLCISDPDNDLDETAQYSSITTQQDGTIGVLFEDYPQVIRDNTASCGKGDYILRSRYMNLRIEDILPDATPIEKESLLPPIITPVSQTYDVNAADTWGDITIKNPNPTGVSSTNYNIQVFGANNKLVKEITENCTFSEDSLVLTWDGNILAEVKEMLAAGYSVRVNAKCYANQDKLDKYSSPSTATSQIYYFKHPTHKVKVVAMPFANSGDPTISIVGSSAEKDTWLVVGEGETITLYGGYGNEPFHFECFSTDSTDKSNFDKQFTPTKVTNNQYTVTIGSGYTGEEITFYAWYKSPAIGVKTRVNTNYYNSEADDAQWIDGKLTLIHKYEFTDWCKNTNYINTYDWGGTDIKAPAGVGKPQFPSFVEGTELSELSFADGEVMDAKAEELYYPTGESKSYKVYGLDLTARIMSDTSTVNQYNAIVMVKRGDDYMTETDFSKNAIANANVLKAPAKASVMSNYYYYVVNGYAQPFSSDGVIAKNSQGVHSWCSKERNTVLPAVSDTMVFKDVIDKTSTETPIYNVVFFIVNKNTLPSIKNLVDGKDYIFKVEHPINPNASKTGIDVTKAANGLLIVGKQGSATFTSNAEQMVRVYNVLGQQVASFNLNGSQTIALPQGVYVAGGQKFIVK